MADETQTRPMVHAAYLKQRPNGRYFYDDADEEDAATMREFWKTLRAASRFSLPKKSRRWWTIFTTAVYSA